MHVLISDAAGFLGHCLTAALLKRGNINGRALTCLTLVDQVALVPPAREGVTLDWRTTDITRHGALGSLFG